MLVRLSFVILSLSFSSCSPTEIEVSTVDSGRTKGQIRGIHTVNQALQSLLEPSGLNPFDLRFLGNGRFQQMSAMLGEYQERGERFHFVGGTANPFGVLIWQQLLARYAKIMGESCGQDQFQWQGGQNFREPVRERLAKLCPNTDLVNSEVSEVELEPEDTVEPIASEPANLPPEMLEKLEQSTEDVEGPAPTRFLDLPAPARHEMIAAMKDLWNWLPGRRSYREREVVLDFITTHNPVVGPELVETFFYVMLMNPHFLLEY